MKHKLEKSIFTKHNSKFSEWEGESYENSFLQLNTDLRAYLNESITDQIDKVFIELQTYDTLYTREKAEEYVRQSRADLTKNLNRSFEEFYAELGLTCAITKKLIPYGEDYYTLCDDRGVIRYSKEGLAILIADAEMHLAGLWAEDKNQ